MVEVVFEDSAAGSLARFRIPSAIPPPLPRQDRLMAGF